MSLRNRQGWCYPLVIIWYIGLLLWSFAVPLLLSYTYPSHQRYLLWMSEVSFSAFDYLAMMALPFFVWGLCNLERAVAKKLELYNKVAKLREMRFPEQELQEIGQVQAWLLELSAPTLSSVAVQVIWWGYVACALQFFQSCGAVPNQIGAVLGAGASIIFPIVIFILGLDKDREPMEVPHHQLFLRYSYAVPGTVLILTALFWIVILQRTCTTWAFAILVLVIDGILLFRVFRLYNDVPLQMRYANTLSRWSIYGW